MAYKIVRANLESDKNHIIRFWNRHHETKLQDKYQHFYLNNPAGKAKVWLLKKDASEKIL